MSTPRDFRDDYDPPPVDPPDLSKDDHADAERVNREQVQPR